MRNPFLGSDQVGRKLGFIATEDGKRLEILDLCTIYVSMVTEDLEMFART